MALKATLADVKAAGIDLTQYIPVSLFDLQSWLGRWVRKRKQRGGSQI